jgi:hypothetical protein
MKDLTGFLKKQIEAVEKTIQETDRITNNIEKLKKHVPFKPIKLRDSEFRYQEFNYRKPFGEGIVYYKDILKKIRLYICDKKLWLEEGLIKCDDLLKKYCESETTTFLKLAVALRRVLV